MTTTSRDTLQECFENMIESMYPGRHIGERQRIDLESAFFGGCLVTFQQMLESSNSEDEEGAAAVFSAIQADINAFAEVAQARAEAFKAASDACPNASRHMDLSER